MQVALSRPRGGERDNASMPARPPPRSPASKEVASSPHSQTFRPSVGDVSGSHPRGLDTNKSREGFSEGCRRVLQKCISIIYRLYYNFG